MIVAGRFVIERCIATGGMGCVYEAFDTKLERSVALKFPLLSSTATPEERARQRAMQMREGKKMARISHDNVVNIYDVYTIEGPEGEPVVFLAMELHEAPTFDEYIAQEHVPPEQMIALVMQAIRGLSAVARSGMVHADVKFENLLVVVRPGEPPRVKVVDFGVARSAAGRRVTGEFQCVPYPFTADFASPESIRGEPLDERADVWSVVVVLYEALLKVHPFGGSDESDDAVMWKVLHVDPPRPRDRVATVDPALDRLMMRGLAKDRNDRLPLAELLAELAPYATGERPVFLPSPPASTTPTQPGTRVSSRSDETIGLPGGALMLDAQADALRRDDMELVRQQPRRARFLAVVAGIAVTSLAAVRIHGALVMSPEPTVTVAPHKQAEDDVATRAPATTPRLLDLTFAGNRGLAVGADGLILRFADAQWQRVVSGTDATLHRAVLLAGGAEAYALGERGVILRSTDGGQTWRQEDSGTDATLTGFAASRDGLRWITGFGGTLLQQVAGRWDAASVPDPATNYMDAAIDATGKLWLVGDSGTIAVRDGDAFRVEHRTAAWGALQRIAFAADGAGIIVGEHVVLALSDEDQWTPQTLAVEANWTRAGFSADGSPWISGREQGRGVLVLRRDRLAQWTAFRSSSSDKPWRTAFLIDGVHGWGFDLTGEPVPVDAIEGVAADPRAPRIANGADDPRAD